MHSIQLPNYKDFLDLFDPEIGKPVLTSEAVYTNQYTKNLFRGVKSYSYGFDINPDIRPLVFSLINDVRDICNEFFLMKKSSHRLINIVHGQASPALLVYEPGGDFSPHNHPRGPKCYTATISIEDIKEKIFFIDIGKKRYNYGDKAGEIKLFRSDNQMHGVRPVPKLRRVMVLDYEYTVGGKSSGEWIPDPLAIPFKDEINA